MKFNRLLLALVLSFALGCKSQAPVAAPTALALVPVPQYSGSLHQTNAQLTVIPVPNPVPSVGNLVGEGKTYTPAVYGNTIFRCTDVNTDPGNMAYHSWEVTDTGSNNGSQFNSNHTMLRVVLSDTGTTEVVGVNAAHRTCTVANPYSKVPTGATWAPNNPNVDYYLSGTTIYKRTFNSLLPLTAPTTQTLVNLAKVCPGLVISTPNAWSGPLSINANGNILVTAFSNQPAQGTGQFAVAYGIGTQKCSVYNTLSGIVAGAVNGKVTTPYTFTIHDIFIYPSGMVQIAHGPTCNGCPPAHGPFLWQVNTLSVVLPTVNAEGHNTLGYKTMLNLSATPKVASRQFSAVDTVTYITSGAGVNFPDPQDTHMGWQNVDPADSFPVFVTQSSTGLTQPIQITSPLQQELYAFIPGTGVFIRFAPTMTSGMKNVFNFRTMYAIAAADKKGACIALSTDWEGTLGNTDGQTPSCTLGTNPPTACRSDVVIVCPK